VADYALVGTVVDAAGNAASRTVTVTVGAATAAQWYVDPTGNDSNTGTTPNAPFRTVQKAATVVNAGDVVLVASGVYTGGSAVLSLNRGGTASAPVIFRSAVRWGAVLDGNNNVSSECIHFGAPNIRIEGFELRNCWHDAVEASASGLANLVISRCHIHHIGKQCSDGSEGRSGIDAYSNSLTVEGCLIHDIGRFGPGEDPTCTPTSTAWQNHDHGIYLGQGAGVIIRNNIFVACDRGWAIQRFGGSFPVDGAIIANNTFAYPNPNKSGQIIVAGNLSNTIFANNIFYLPKDAGIWWSGGTMSNVQVFNNLSTGLLSLGTPGGVTFTNNLVGDPRFVDAVGGDFHLAAGSPALGAGASLAQVTDNFDGTARTSPPTIGAY